MRAACAVALYLSISAVGCAGKTPAAADQGDGQDRPRITLEDVERSRVATDRYDRGVISLGTLEAGLSEAGQAEGAPPEGDRAETAPAESEGGFDIDAEADQEGGGPGDLGEGDEVAEEGVYVGADEGEGDETLGNDEGDEGI